MSMPRIVRDVFRPVLTSPAVVLSAERLQLIRAVLDVTSSDSRSAEKAWTAITFILATAPVKTPTVTTLSPASVDTGSIFVLTVNGTNFDPQSVVIVGGHEVPTTFVGPTQLTADVTAPGVPATLPVHVLSGDGVLSSPTNLTVVVPVPPPPPPPTPPTP